MMSSCWMMPGVGVELAAVLEHDEVTPAPIVDEEHALLGREQPPHEPNLTSST